MSGNWRPTPSWLGASTPANTDPPRVSRKDMGCSGSWARSWRTAASISSNHSSQPALQKLAARARTKSRSAGILP
jgi:hypothetical protein